MLSFSLKGMEVVERIRPSLELWRITAFKGCGKKQRRAEETQKEQYK